MACRYTSFVVRLESLLNSRARVCRLSEHRQYSTQIAQHMRHFTSSYKTRLSTLNNEWQVLKSEVPKGFEKYFPGGKKTQAKPEEAPKSETKGSSTAQPKESAKEAPSKEPHSKSSGSSSKGPDKKFEFSFNLAKSRAVGDPNDPNNRLFFMVLTGVTVIGLGRKAHV